MLILTIYLCLYVSYNYNALDFYKTCIALRMVTHELQLC